MEKSLKLFSSLLLCCGDPYLFCVYFLMVGCSSWLCFLLFIYSSKLMSLCSLSCDFLKFSSR